MLFYGCFRVGNEGECLFTRVQFTDKDPGNVLLCFERPKITIECARVCKLPRIQRSPQAHCSCSSFHWELSKWFKIAIYHLPPTLALVGLYLYQGYNRKCKQIVLSGDCYCSGNDYYKTGHRRDSPPPFLMGQLTAQNKISETTHRHVACLALCIDWIRIRWIKTAHQLWIGVGMLGGCSEQQLRLHTFSKC